MSEATNNGEHAASTQEAQAHEEALSKWGIQLEELYRYSLTFLKDKGGSKAIRLSYADKIQLVAYEKQVIHGPFRADLKHDCGFFDVVGNDRKNAWSQLGNLPRSVAMLEHVKLVHSRCPLLNVFIEAQKVNQGKNSNSTQAHSNSSHSQPQLQQASNAAASEPHTQQNTNDSYLHSQTLLQQSIMPQVDGITLGESETDTQAKVEALSSDLQKLKLEEEQLRSQQEAQIRTLLNQQTAIQFRQYAQEQHANDPKKQEELVRQLQQQHFQQYMTQVLKQQIEHQKQQARQIAAMLRQQRKQQIEQLARTNQPDDNGNTPQGGLQIVDEGNDEGAAASTNRPNGAHALTQLGAAPSATSAGQLVPPRTADDAESNVDDDTDGEADLSDGDDESDAGKIMMPQLIPASLWTRKDTTEFKQKVWKTNRECAVKIGSLATATVRVPTHPDGSCIFWEFATDNYDIGFGVYFEWNLNPGDKITVHISESDDEDPDDEDAPPNPEGKDPERGKKKKENEQPTDEIIPVYRRDSHEEVYCGSHTYPGKGVYLLKFDNSYSLWRSKWVYYRVYYGK